MPNVTRKLAVEMCADGGFDLVFTNDVQIGTNPQFSLQPGVRGEVSIADDRKSIHIYCHSASNIDGNFLYVDADMPDALEVISYKSSAGNGGWWQITGYERGQFFAPNMDNGVCSRLPLTAQTLTRNYATSAFQGVSNGQGQQQGTV